MTKSKAIPQKRLNNLFFLSVNGREREIHSNTSNLIMKKAEEEEEEVKRDMKNEQHGRMKDEKKQQKPLL